MNDPAALVALVSVGASLFLAIRSYRSRGISGQNTMLMGLVWVILIAGLALLLGHLRG